MSPKEDIRIVLVDDDRDACESLSEVLQFDGYSVRFAMTAQEAMTAVEEFQPICALVDQIGRASCRERV